MGKLKSFALLLALLLQVCAPRLSAQEDIKPQADSKPPNEMGTGCAGHGALALQFLKRAVFSAPAFPDEAERHIACTDLVSIPFSEYSNFFVVQVRNEAFCRDELCVTFIYSASKQEILFVFEAKNSIYPLMTQEVIVPELTELYNHKFINQYNHVLLTSRSGTIRISLGFGDIIMLSFEPK